MIQGKVVILPAVRIISRQCMLMKKAQKVEGLVESSMDLGTLCPCIHFTFCEPQFLNLSNEDN